MRRIRYFALGLLVAASLGAYAVTSGGYPSAPTFQQATVKSTGGRACAANASSNLTSACFNTTVTGHTNWTAAVAPLGGSGNELGLLVDGGAAALASTDIIFRVNGGNVSQALQVDGLGVVTTGSFRIPKFSFGEFIGNAGGCSNNSGVWQTQNMGGTCTRNSVGNYTIAFSVAYAGSPICEAQVTSALAGIAGVNTAGTTTVTVQTGTTAFAAADSSFFVTCTGF